MLTVIVPPSTTQPFLVRMQRAASASAQVVRERRSGSDRRVGAQRYEHGQRIGQRRACYAQPMMVRCAVSD